MGLFGKWSRRDLLKNSGAVAGVAAAGPAAAVAATAAPKRDMVVNSGTLEDNLYTRIGVRPILNARGTYTIISGSRSLPQVKQAMFEASHYYVQMDEMMEAVGKELARLNGCEAAMVTNGCESAIVLATIASIAGANIEKCQALPYIKAKDQVIIPKHSRNPYDFGLRVSGAQLVEVETPDELRAKISPRTAMIYVASNPSEAKSVLPIATIINIAKEKNIPVFVDAAAEEPMSPNVYMQQGASFVGYSGGKCLRAPQSSGMLLGKKDLIKAAWFQASPHHNYARALKCSKEETMGLLAAVRQWYKRDHDGEQRMWRGWMNHVEARLKPIKGLQFEYLEPNSLSNRATRLRIKWDAAEVGITGNELEKRLNDGSPRIMVEPSTGHRPDAMASYVTLMPYMMDPGDERVLADALYKIFSNPGHYTDPVVPSGAPAAMAGTWAVTIQYACGMGEQHFTLKQDGNAVTGDQKGELYNATLHGTIHGDQLKLRSTMPVSGYAIQWTFEGAVRGSSISGSVNMGEYGPATWTAMRV
jgi:uncharacterized pyridoxal phosphate-dependent enzyme